MLSPDPLFKTVLYSWDAIAFTALLVVALPAYAYFSLRPQLGGKAQVGASARLRFYIKFIAIQWLLVAGMIFVARRHGLSLADLGQHLAHPIRLLIVTASLFVVICALLFLDYRKHLRLSQEDLVKALAPIKIFIPVGAAEILAAVGMAITAGICEELLYRGWILNLAAAGTNSIWIGLVVASIVFGLGHAYQGIQGVIATSVVGIILGFVFMYTESLLPVQVIHALVDLGGMLVGVSLMAKTQATVLKASS